ncbi:MAG: Ku protein [Alphaproteobacteria bacterium]
MAARTMWKGWLRLGALTCPVALHAAVSEGERIHLHIVNRRSGSRVRRQFVDNETGDVVDREDQVKGYEVSDGRFAILEQEEIDAAIPESTRTIELEAFVAADDFDPVHVDRPYFLTATDSTGEEALAVIRQAMAAKGVVGIGRTVLFRRDRTLLLCGHAPGFIACTLHPGYEVRAAGEILGGVGEIEITDEMIELAQHIIAQRKGEFAPDAFEDRYETALAELIKAKKAGKKPPRPKAPARGNVVDLLDALRRSAKGAEADRPARRKAATRKVSSARKAPARRRKAG